MRLPEFERSALTRRTFISTTSSIAGALATTVQAHGACTEGEYPKRSARQATGVRVGEVTDNSAVVWTRLTADEERKHDGVVIKGRDAQIKVPVDEHEGACCGAKGRVRLRYGEHEDLSDAIATPWHDVSEQTDFSHQFPLTRLAPATTYHYASETSGPAGSPLHDAIRGKFDTAPAATTPSQLTFTVMTCQGYPDRGHPDGHPIYPAMLALQPKFACLTGDLVYYDNDAPRAVTQRLARYHRERMFSLPRLREFTRQVATYWLKDDHDTLNNDSWVGAKMGEFTFAQGQEIFRQQAPLGAGPSYRTFRWGRDLQIWLTDGRDFRSPNRMPDGPEKTIWGAEQKAWFKRTVAESNARWQILITPTPLVGPDRRGKNDKHANAGFNTKATKSAPGSKRTCRTISFPIAATGTGNFILCIPNLACMNSALVLRATSMPAARLVLARSITSSIASKAASCRSHSLPQKAAVRFDYASEL